MEIYFLLLNQRVDQLSSNQAIIELYFNITEIVKWVFLYMKSHT